MAKVAVLMGGSSFEREFSLISGKNICAALEEAGHRTVPLDTNEQLVPTLRSEKPDVVYNALHGKHGEDGTIQSLLEFLDIPFVGSPASVCHRSWNKDALHSSVAKYRQISGEVDGVASWPPGVFIAADAFKKMGAAMALDLVGERIPGGYPVCVKPAHGGSALGVHRVDSQEELGEAREACDEQDPAHMEEEFGDLMFAVINASRLYGIDPEVALGHACDKFRRRFTYLEENTIRKGRKLTDMTLAQMDAIWDEGKARGL